MASSLMIEYRGHGALGAHRLRERKSEWREVIRADARFTETLIAVELLTGVGPPDTAEPDAAERAPFGFSRA